MSDQSSPSPSALDPKPPDGYATWLDFVTRPNAWRTQPEEGPWGWARNDLAAIRSRAAALEAALREIASSKLTEEPSRMSGTGNEDDAYDSGYDRAEFFAAKIARAALDQAAREALGGS